MKLGALTVCLNEEATIVYTIASLLPYIDHYVVVDTGSTDKTLMLIKKIFKSELEHRKLCLIEYGPLPDYDISKPKNEAIETLRAEGCSRFIRLDADDVFFNIGAQWAANKARELPDDITLFTINHWELYQFSYQNSTDWTLGLIDGIAQNMANGFYCMRIPPSYDGRFTGSYGHARIYKTEGAVSRGKWTDEAWGNGPGEDIGHPGQRRKCIGCPDELIVHYGWARPMEKKMAKNKIWASPGDIDPRVKGLEQRYEFVPEINLDRFTYGFKYWPRQLLFPFTQHPESVQMFAPQVAELLI